MNAPWSPQDATKPSWALVENMPTDSFTVYRRAANAAAGAVTALLTLDSAGKTTCTLADGIVTKAMLAPGAATNTVYNGAVTAGAQTTTSLLKFATVTASNIIGRMVLIYLSAATAVGNSTTGQTVGVVLRRNGSDFMTWFFPLGSGTVVEFPLPLTLLAADASAPAGSVVYEFFFWTSSASANVHIPASNPGLLQVFAFS